jgi:hypothetical protein
MQCVVEKVSIAFGKENPITVALGAERNSPARRIARIGEFLSMGNETDEVTAAFLNLTAGRRFASGLQRGMS